MTQKAGSGGAARNPNSLANLKRGNVDTLVPGAGPKFEPGASPQLRHGLRTRNPSVDVMDPVLDVVLEELEARVPIRDEHGDVVVWLRELAWSAAIKKLQVVRCARFIAQHGDVDEKGRRRPENDALTKAAESYERSLDRLAMTVTSRARVGLDVARTAQAQPDLALQFEDDARDDSAIEGSVDDAA